MFTSFYFLIFLLILSLLYLATPAGRPLLLLAFSYLFCAVLGLRCLIILLLLSIFTFFSAILIEKSRLMKYTALSRCLSIVSISFCVLLMIGYKYIPWLLRISGKDIQLSQSPAGHLTVPIGLSFYLFQAIGYLADISSGKYPAGRSFAAFGLYMSYFPKFVSGPIERFPEFSAQLWGLKNLKFWDRGRLSSAFTYMLYGYFMKLVVADRLSPIVTVLFEAPESFDSFLLFIGAFFYTIQIYCDFAGYSFIAIGCSKLFGISLTANFVTPYFAQNITDFWHRWHVSLSRWLRDYIYIPLGGNRKGLSKKYINTLIVFLLCGMWHGAGFSFIAWGLLHGLYSIIDTLLRKSERKLPLCRFVTFLEVSAAWIFFRATGLKSALKYLLCMLTSGIHFNNMSFMLTALRLNAIEIAVIITGIFMVFLMDYQGYRQNMLFPDLVQEKAYSVRYLIFYILIILLFVFGIYGPGYNTEQFIYMQF